MRQLRTPDGDRESSAETYATRREPANQFLCHDRQPNLAKRTLRFCNIDTLRFRNTALYWRSLADR
jgi:hypothetical protein